MKTEDKIFVGVVTVFLLFIASVTVVIYNAREEHTQQEDQRQKEVNAFYLLHKCKPLNYVSSKYGPVRTYQCDNGVYITADMK